MVMLMRTEKFVIPPIYFLASEFSENGIAEVANKEGWFIINKKGEKILKPFIFDNAADEFYCGLARYVDDNEKNGIL